MLGAIVAAVANRSYYDYVREHVFARAGMRRTDFFTKPQVLAAADVARPYATQPAGARVDFTSSEYFPFVGGPHRGAYTTAGDLLAFSRALAGGRLLDPAYVQLLTAGKFPTDTALRAHGVADTIVNLGRQLVTLR